LDQHEPLGVGDNLGGVEGLLEVGKELLLVAIELLDLRTTKDLGGTTTLSLQGRQATSEDGFTNEGDGHAKIKSVDGSPLAGTLLTSRVEDLLRDWGSVIVLLAHDVAGDLDQERVKNALVPLVKDISHLVVGHAETTLHDVVRLENVSIQEQKLLQGQGLRAPQCIPQRSTACHRTQYRCGPS
jgi:hypothetical protein